MAILLHVIRFFLLVLPVLSGCMATLPEIQEPGAGSYRVSTSITYNLSDRKFLLHVPPDYTTKTPLPLVVAIRDIIPLQLKLDLLKGTEVSP